MREFTSNTFKLMPWKNGRGITTEIYREELGGKMSFRLSRAVIDEDGPFSIFNSYKRHLIVLEGEGCYLNLQGTEHTLRRNEIFSFRGDQQVHARLIKGAVEDFNIFFDEKIYDCEVSWIENRQITASERVFLYSPEENKLYLLQDNEFFFVHERMISIELAAAP